MIREKLVVKVTVSRIVEIDGVDSLEKPVVQETVVVDDLPEATEKLAEIVKRGIEIPFRLL